MNSTEVFDLQSPANLWTFLSRLLTEDFMPHGHCYFWRPDILWLNVLSDAGIALAYYSIPITIFYFWSKRRDVPFHWIFLMFGAFIFLCGTTHVIDIVTTWTPVYRLEGVVKLITAVVSLATAAALIPIMPKAISLPSIESYSRSLEAKSKELENTNKELERFNKATVGREERVIELKKEINNLSRELGRPEPYELVE